MKIIRWALFLILLIAILCGCSSQIGSMQTPYLNQKERAKIEKSILNGLEFIVKDNNSMQISFQNDTDYTLWDVEFVSNETRNIFFSVPLLEKKMVCNAGINHTELSEANSNTSIYMVYTIDDYTYYSDFMVPVRKVDTPGSDTASAYQVSIMTKDGMKELDASKPLEFFSGTEISGLKKFKINSIIPEVPYNGAIKFLVTGSDPNDYRIDLIAKLQNEDGVIVSSNSVYISNGEGTIYCFDTEPGNYTLIFEETN